MNILGTTLLSLALLGPPPPTTQISLPMPTQIPGWDGIRYPIWVAASIALTPDGRPNPRLFDASAIQQLDWMLAEPERDGCVRVGPVVLDGLANSRRRESLDSTVDTAPFILEGLIDGISPGFYSGIPGQLYRITAIRTLKGRSLRHYYFSFLPVGEVQLGPKRICSTDTRYLAVPTIGQRVVLLTAEPTGGEKEFVDIEAPEDYAVEVKDGRAMVAPAHAVSQAELADATFDQVLSYIERRVATPKGVSR